MDINIVKDSIMYNEKLKTLILPKMDEKLLYQLLDIASNKPNITHIELKTPEVDEEEFDDNYKYYTKLTNDKNITHKLNILQFFDKENIPRTMIIDGFTIKTPIYKSKVVNEILSSSTSDELLLLLELNSINNNDMDEKSLTTLFDKITYNKISKINSPLFAKLIIEKLYPL